MNTLNTEVSTDQIDISFTNLSDNMSADSDGDGVSDVLDKCPDTPLNESVVASGCALTIQTYVPADGFEQFLIDSGYDDVLNDHVLTANIENIEELSFDGGFCTFDLTGLEAFKSLIRLDIEKSSIGSFDFSVLKKLEQLILYEVTLNSLKMVGTCIIFLGFEAVNVSGEMIISKNHILSYFGYNNGSMDDFTIASNPVLPSLVFESVGGGEDLMVTNNKSLTDYSCNTCAFNDVSFIGNANLESVFLDIGAGGALETITANDNPKLTSFDDQNLLFDTTIISLEKTMVLTK